ncbi:MAG: class I tRNA ligase family protein [Candidatus Peribacteria bacterium]|nr:class I tRNA ligase family protein [Candidatus Peribacteria bacterium]
MYPTDQWILEKLQTTIQKMNNYLDHYEYGLAKIAFEEFFRKDFCDNYLELIKVRLYQPERFEEGKKKKNSGQKTLHTVFYTVIQLIAPYLPHITEEIYQDYFLTNIHSIHKTPYPTTVPYLSEEE